MDYISFKLIVRLESGEKMTFKVTAKDKEVAKSHVQNYLNKKQVQIRSIHCVVINNYPS